MARPCLFENSIVISTRLDREMYQKLNDISALETINTGKKVHVQELIRNALKFVYEDNERLRECFRRSRNNVRKNFK